MLLDTRTLEHLINAIDYAAYEIYNDRSWGYSITIYDIILNFRLRQIIRDADKYMDKILKNVPKTYQSKIKKAVRLLSKNLNNTLYMLERNPPAWLRNAVLAKFLERIGYPYATKSILEKHRAELLKNIPGKARSWSSTRYRGREFTGLILYPTEKELAQLEIPDIESLYDDLLGEIMTSKLEFIPEKQAVRIFDYELTFPRGEYYKILREFYRYDDIVRLIREDMGSVLEELEKLGSVKLSYDSITIELKDEVLESINTKYNLNITEAVFHFSIAPERGTGRLYLKVDGKMFAIKSPYNEICAAINCRSDIESFAFNEYSELPELIMRMLDRAKEIVQYTEKKIEYIKKIASEKGFDVGEINYPGSYEHWVKIRLEKTVSEKTTASVLITLDLETGKETVGYSISIKMKRKIPEDVVITAINSVGVYDEYRLRWYKGWNIESRTTYKLDELPKVLEMVTRLAETVNRVYEEHVVSAKKRREELKLSPEQYVAIYLNNSNSTRLGAPRIVVEKETGRPEIVMYSVVSRILSKLAPGYKCSPKKDSVDVAVLLFEKNYITVDKDLKLYINGKRFTDLLKPFGILPTILESTEKSLAVWLIAEYVYSKTSISRKGIVKALHEKGVFSDTVIQHLIADGFVYIPPEEMAYRINDKPAWHYLSPPTKKIYIEKLPLADYAEIYFNPRLRAIFNDVISLVRHEILTSGEASLITKLVVNDWPKLIGYRPNMNIIDTGDFYGIDAGAFVIQLYKLAPLRPEDNEFIVYRKDTKIGFVFKGRTIIDAFNEALRRYDRIYAVYEHLEKNQEEIWKKHRAILQHRSFGTYNLPYLQLGGQILFIDEHALDRLKERKEESVEEVV